MLSREGACGTLRAIWEAPRQRELGRRQRPCGPPLAAPRARAAGHPHRASESVEEPYQANPPRQRIRASESAAFHRPVSEANRRPWGAAGTPLPKRFPRAKIAPLTARRMLPPKREAALRGIPRTNWRDRPRLGVRWTRKKARSNRVPRAVSHCEKGAQGPLEPTLAEGTDIRR